MTSYVLQVNSSHSAHRQVTLTYNERFLKFDGADFPESEQSAGCLPCIPSAATGNHRQFANLDIVNITIERDHFLVIATCYHKNEKADPVLEFFEFGIVDKEAANLWRTQVLAHVYTGLKMNRHFKVIVNPFGGQGHAKSIWEHKVLPLFQAAGCTHDLTYTTHRYHAKEIAQQLDIHAFDAIVTVSGDGIIHEVINGLLDRPDAKDAHKLALAPVPGGSGNALCFSLAGEDHGSHACKAALNCIKGKAVALDLCSVTQGDKRFFSFELQSYGMIADVDLGTEHMRWMGEARFTVAVVGKLLTRQSYGCELAYIPVQSDVKQMREDYHTARRAPVDWVEDQPPLSAEQDSEGRIVDKFGKVTDEYTKDWVVESNSEVITVVGAMVPWISKGSITHPFAQPNDGLIDLLIFPKGMTRGASVQAMLGAETGVHVDVPGVRYIKVKAFRITPPKHIKTGYISFDGEHGDFVPYQVEAHRGLFSVLSVTGRYAPCITPQ